MENGGEHEYCCREHAVQHLVEGFRPDPRTWINDHGGPRCLLPNCPNPQHEKHPFCGITHALASKRIQLLSEQGADTDMSREKVRHRNANGKELAQHLNQRDMINYPTPTMRLRTAGVAGCMCNN